MQTKRKPVSFSFRESTPPLIAAIARELNLTRSRLLENLIIERYKKIFGEQKKIKTKN